MKERKSAEDERIIKKNVVYSPPKKRSSGSTPVYSTIPRKFIAIWSFYFRFIIRHKRRTLNTNRGEQANKFTYIRVSLPNRNVKGAFVLRHSHRRDSSILLKTVQCIFKF